MQRLLAMVFAVTAVLVTASTETPIERPRIDSAGRSLIIAQTVIGPTDTVTRPEPPPSVMKQPESNASAGPKETGPHGQVDVTKPMPKSAPEAVRVEPDRTIAVPVTKP